MRCNEKFNSIREQINLSNRIASTNMNLYPIQEQAVLLEVWERVDVDILCKSPIEHTRYVHVLKPNLCFDDVKIAYLKMFTSRNYHTRLIDLLGQNLNYEPDLPSRIKGAYKWLRYLKDNWDRLYKIALNWNRSLFCSEFIPSEIVESKEWDFNIQDSVYRSKMWAILFPDICVPYDNLSRIKIKRCIGVSNINYAEMLFALRKYAVEIISVEESNVSEFRKLDNPEIGCPYNSFNISLPIDHIDYGGGYNPEERPISRIIDKFFYNPGGYRGHKPQSFDISPVNNDDFPDRPIRRREPGNQNEPLFGGDILPLSGYGEKISWDQIDNGRNFHIKWGDTEFNLRELEYDLILDTFFSDDEWHKLGSSMTNPSQGGLGEFLKNNIPRYSPRHASAIAAILVYLGELEFKGQKTILLRRKYSE